MEKLRELTKGIRESGVFDSEWYLQEYPDVARLGIEPVEHYVRWGWKLGRRTKSNVDGNPLGGAGGVGQSSIQSFFEGRRAELERACNDLGGISGILSAGQRRPENRTSKRKVPISALVIAWDVGHNPLGRAYMLAEVLDRVVGNVVLVGFQFPRYGASLWEPVRQGRLPVITLPTGNFPEMLAIWDRLTQRFSPDIVFACKARLPSLQLAAMIRRRARCPLILDIDDHELSFFGDAPQLEPSHLAAFEPGSSLSHEPYERIWTQLAHGLRGSADQIIVSNPALQREFGGTIVPHVRDELTFDLSRHDRKASRAKYGVPASAKVTLFFGTPRAHKGIQALAEAVGKLSDADHCLVVVGTATDKRDAARLHQLAPGRVILIPNQPFDAIPEIVSMADVVCLPQDLSSPVSRYQLPAKAIDAIAMNVPLLVVPTEPLSQLISDGLALPVDPSRLSEAIARATKEPRTAYAERMRRERYLSQYSYAAAEKTLRQVIERARETPIKGEDPPLEELLGHQRRLLTSQIPSTTHAARRKGRCIVLFWKQNDTTLYGRRHDMVIAYLASRDDIRKVVVFDAPISEHELLVRRNRAKEPTQDRHVYVRTYQKLAGYFDTDKISYHVFIHPPGRYRAAPDGSSDALSAAFSDYVGGVLQAEEVAPADAIFWFYPRNYHAAALIDRLRPARVVVDVVDDHRAWPDVSEKERERLTEHYRDMLGRASLALANCQPVLEAMHPYNSQIRLIPNGCDDNTPIVPPTGDPAFEELCAFPGKTIGFVGNLERKLDIDLIEKIADRFSECLVLLLGSTHANPDIIRLRGRPNVRMPGVIPYEHVGAWVSRFHVGIIPHVNSELTRSMNPLKLYVYLSLGVPVVCTEIPNVDRSLQSVRFAETHETFLETIADTLGNPQMDTQALQKYVAENSWKVRFKDCLDAFFAQDATGMA